MDCLFFLAFPLTFCPCRRGNRSARRGPNEGPQDSTRHPPNLYSRRSRIWRVLLRQGCRNGRQSVRVRSDVFSTRYKISSNRSNAGLWIVRQGRSAGMSRSVAVRVTPLTRRCRPSARTARTARPDEERTARRLPSRRDRPDHDPAFDSAGSRRIYRISPSL